MVNKASVVIIGAGISGCSIAYHLAEKGMKDIVVVDKSYISSGATGRCGAGVRMQWGTKMNCLLAKKSIEFYEHADEILEYKRGVHFHQGGYLLLAYSEKELAQFKLNVKLQNSVGIPSKIVTVKEAKEIVPHLNTQGLYGGAFCKRDGFLDPFLTTDAFYLAAKRRGVKFLTYTQVRDIVTEKGTVSIVKTDKGDIHTEMVVNASGGYAQEIAKILGINMPVYSRRHQILVTEPVEHVQGPMVMSFSKNFYCQQNPKGPFIMGRGDDLEPTDLSIQSSWQFLEKMAKTIQHVLPPVSDLRVIRQWAGLYNMTPDKQPIYGTVEGIKGYYQALGFSGHGFMLGPLTGMIMSEMILGLPHEIDISPLSLTRFERGDLILEPSVV